MKRLGQLVAVSGPALLIGMERFKYISKDINTALGHIPDGGGNPWVDNGSYVFVLLFFLFIIWGCRREIIRALRNVAWREKWRAFRNWLTVPRLLLLCLIGAVLAAEITVLSLIQSRTSQSARRRGAGWPAASFWQRSTCASPTSPSPPGRRLTGCSLPRPVAARSSPHVSGLW